MRVTEIKAPATYSTEGKITVFLAGAIDMGAAEDWQKKVVEYFKDWNRPTEILFLNPRRDDWDSSWKQTPDDTQFNHQVNWELDGLNAADIVFLCLPASSKAPISLLELGVMVGSSKPMVVMCDQNFYRYGNVAITCSRYGCSLYTEMDKALSALKMKCTMQSVAM